MSEDESKITSEEEEQEDEPEVKTPKGKRGRPAKGAAKTPTPKKAGKKEVDEVSFRVFWFVFCLTHRVFQFRFDGEGFFWFFVNFEF